jgi:hypothetical protein
MALPAIGSIAGLSEDNNYNRNKYKKDPADGSFLMENLKSKFQCKSNTYIGRDIK